MRKVSVIGSASGNGKTTLGLALAERLRVPFYELDSLHHGPNWTEATADELRAKVEPIVAREAWVIDGTYRGKLGNLVLDGSELVVWLDLPIRIWLPRLLHRTFRRIARGEELWNGNRESFHGAFLGRDALFPYAIRSHFRRRRVYPTELAAYRVARLRSTAEVKRFLAAVKPEPAAAAPPARL